MSKKIILFIVSGILFALFFVVVILESIVYDTIGYYDFLFDMFEMLFISGGTLSLSISFNFQKNENKIEKANSSSIIQSSGNNNQVMVNNNISSLALLLETKNQIQNIAADNIEIIFKKSEEALKNEQPNNIMNKDFIVKYIMESSCISEKDIQDIWVKLLVQENKRAGSISKRTLDIVKNLYSSEAKLFMEVAKYSFEDAIYKDLHDFSFDEISKLQDIGLIKSNDFIAMNFEIEGYGMIDFKNINYSIVIKNTSPDIQNIELDCKAFTAEGFELKKALGIEISDDLIKKFYEKIKEKLSRNPNLSISISKINRSHNSI